MRKEKKYKKCACSTVLYMYMYNENKLHIRAIRIHGSFYPFLYVIHFFSFFFSFEISLPIFVQISNRHQKSQVSFPKSKMASIILFKNNNHKVTHDFVINVVSNVFCFCNPVLALVSTTHCIKWARIP